MSGLRDPFIQGIVAFLGGVSRLDCPHPDDTTEQRQWLEGWDFGHHLPDHSTELLGDRPLAPYVGFRSEGVERGADAGAEVQQPLEGREKKGRRSRGICSCLRRGQRSVRRIGSKIRSPAANMGAHETQQN
jgi:hypothetical protein